MLVIYGLKTCDTCRKATSTLESAGFTPTLCDVRQDRLTSEALSRFIARFGDALVNRRSTTWRGLGEAERAKEPLALLAAHPALMKRPVIDHDGTLYLGWAKDVQTALLGGR